ncbi:MAG: aminoacyl-tRNA hydrolase [Actinomycetota bacterium]|nr:aminoacyl-tRNA hydrolase [Actinomycetota bacterium]
MGLGNPGERYAGTRHNVGFEIASALAEGWSLGRWRRKFGAQLAEGRAGPGGPRVAVMLPQTYMNEAGRSVGPARGSFKVRLDRVLVIHDEIDLPFGEVRARTGGGLAGHNGLKSVAAELGGREFARIRVGVGRPDSSDPDVVAAYVLAGFREPPDQVRELIRAGREAAETTVSASVSA